MQKHADFLTMLKAGRLSFVDLRGYRVLGYHDNQNNYWTKPEQCTRLPLTPHVCMRRGNEAMPLIQLHVFETYPEAEKRRLLTAFRTAIRQAFSIEDDGLYLLLQEHIGADCLLPPGKPPLIAEVTCFAGRSPEQKAEFYRLAALGLSALGRDTEEFLFILHEPPLCNWGLGGRPMAEALNIK